MPRKVKSPFFLSSTTFYYKLLIFLILHLVSASITHHDIQDYVIAQAQCKAMCLKSYVDGLQTQVQTEGGLSLTANHSIDILRNRTYLLERFCERRSSCKRCDDGCKANHTTNCLKHCEGDTFCISGCQNLLHLMRAKETRCSTHFKSFSSRGMCHKVCENDEDCRSKFEAGSKCCQRSCSSDCVVTQSFDEELPLFPTVTVKHRSNKEGELINFIEWRPVNQDFKRPVVYAILIRFVISDKFEIQNASQWDILDTTARKDIDLHDLKVGYIYQIKAAAVSHLGTRGFGKLSQSIRLRQKPRPPNVPLNFTDGVWRIYASGSININIHWMKPKPSDLEIYAYEICWVRDHGYVQSDGRSIVSLTKFTKRIFPTTFNYVIENLDASTSYKVELRAQSKWGEHDLFSRPNTIYITTPKTGNMRTNEMKTVNSSNNCHCDDQKRLKDSDFTIMQPIFDTSLTMRILRTAVTEEHESLYQVEWAPRVCIDSQSNSEGAGYSLNNGNSFKATTQNSLFIMHNLIFNCRYMLRITQLHDSKTFSTCFCTSSCAETRVQEDSKSKKECPSPIETRALEPPTSLKVFRKDTTGNTFVVHWTQQQNSKYPITNYRIVWGPRLDEPVNKESYSRNGLQVPLDIGRSQTRVVSKNVKSLVLQNLNPATLYIVKVQALSLLFGREGESLEIESIFTTPGFPLYRVNTASFSGEVSKYVKHPAVNSAANLTLPILLWYRSFSSFAALILLYDLLLKATQR